MALAKSAGAPSIVVLGGPNGAGKSTAAPRLLRGALRVDPRVKLRVEGGGHGVPAATVRRRFERGRAGPHVDCDWSTREPPAYPEQGSMGARDSKRPVGRGRRSITEVFDEGHAIDNALRLGVQDALLRHKRLGQRVATWKNGRVVVLEPSEIRIGGGAGDTA